MCEFQGLKKILIYKKWKIHQEKDNSSMDSAEFKDSINKLDIIDIYRLLQPTIPEYTFFSYGTFTKIYHVLGHKTVLTNLKDYSWYSICSQTAVEDRNQWKAMIER